MQGLNVPFWQFFIQGWCGRALIVRPSRIPRWISKINFVLGSYEFLAMLEGKSRKGPFFKRFNLVKWQCDYFLNRIHDLTRTWNRSDSYVSHCMYIVQTVRYVCYECQCRIWTWWDFTPLCWALRKSPVIVFLKKVLWWTLFKKKQFDIWAGLGWFSSSVDKALEYKVGPYGLLFSWYTLSIRSFLRGQNGKLWR